MRARQLVHVQYMSTFHGTNGMSIKWRYTDAFSPVGPEMLSGDAALLFQSYSGCTGNILSFYPSTSPRSISDPLTINNFFCSKFASLGFPFLGTSISSCCFPCTQRFVPNSPFVSYFFFLSITSLHGFPLHQYRKRAQLWRMRSLVSDGLERRNIFSTQPRYDIITIYMNYQMMLHPNMYEIILHDA